VPTKPGVTNDSTAGKSNCAHAKLFKEYYLGAQTGDYVCADCGVVLSPAELEKIRKG
jgi:hypothetical protein